MEVKTTWYNFIFDETETKTYKKVKSIKVQASQSDRYPYAILTYEDGTEEETSLFHTLEVK